MKKYGGSDVTRNNGREDAIRRRRRNPKESGKARKKVAPGRRPTWWRSMKYRIAIPKGRTASSPLGLEEMNLVHRVVVAEQTQVVCPTVHVLVEPRKRADHESAIRCGVRSDHLQRMHQETAETIRAWVDLRGFVRNTRRRGCVHGAVQHAHFFHDGSPGCWGCAPRGHRRIPASPGTGRTRQPPLA